MKLDWRNKLISFKVILQRGYLWCHLPTIALIGAGVIKPYFPKWHLWQLALLALTIFLLVGVIDYKLKIFHAEQSWTTKRNPLMMKGLFEERKVESKK